MEIRLGDNLIVIVPHNAGLYILPSCCFDADALTSQTVERRPVKSIPVVWSYSLHS